MSANTMFATIMRKMFARMGSNMQKLGKWTLKNQNLVAGLGGAALITVDGRIRGHGVKAEILGELALFRTTVNEKFTTVNEKLFDLQKQLTEVKDEIEITQSLLLRTAVKTMKALDGNKTEMREFVKEVETVVRCAEGSGDFDEGSGN